MAAHNTPVTYPIRGMKVPWHCLTVVADRTHRNRERKEDSMILVRFVCQARVGKASDVVAGFKRSNEIARTVAGPNVRARLLTDLSGAFDTVVQELELESLAEWERLRTVIFSNPEIQ